MSRFKNFGYSIFFLFAVTSLSSFAIDGLYVGGQVGHVGLTGDVSRIANNAIGFGGDLGLKTGGPLDVVLSGQYSSHGGSADLGLTALTMSADFHAGRVHDFDFILGIGPGFYFFKAAGVTETKFGVQFGAASDVILDENLRVGLGLKYHGVFSGNATSGSYWTIMMRFGYNFNFAS